jgi:hypothetical protein
MTTNAPQGSERPWATPIIGSAEPITGPFHRLDILGYRPYTLPGGNPLIGKLSPHSKVTPKTFGKVPVELNYLGHYRGMHQWTKRRFTTQEQAIVWQRRNENQLIRTGRIETFPKDAPALIAIDCDAETPDMSATFLEISEKKFGRLSLRRRPGKPHRWLAVVRGVDGAGDLKSIRVPYTDRDGGEGRIEVLIRGCQFVAGGVNANGATWEWPDGMPAIHDLPSATIEKLHELENELQAAVISLGGKLGTRRAQERSREKLERREKPAPTGRELGTAEDQEGSKERPAPRVKREPKRREDCDAEEWINQEALRHLDDWVLVLFPAAQPRADSGQVYS